MSLLPIVAKDAHFNKTNNYCTSRVKVDIGTMKLGAEQSTLTFTWRKAAIFLLRNGCQQFSKTNTIKQKGYAIQENIVAPQKKQQLTGSKTSDMYHSTGDRVGPLSAVLLKTVTNLRKRAVQLM